MDNIEIYKKILEINDKKNKHLQEYSDRMNILAQSNSTLIFIEGECEECNKYENQTRQLENMLNRKG